MAANAQLPTPVCGRPTKDGTPCSRTLKAEAKTCWQHARGIRQWWRAIGPLYRFFVKSVVAISVLLGILASILIPEEDWQKHRNDLNLSIQVTLHKEGDLNATYPGTGSFTVPLAQFDGPDSRDPDRVRFGGGKVRWAVVDPTRSSASLPDLAPDKMQNMQHLLTLVNQINAGTSVAPTKTIGFILARISVLIVVMFGLAAAAFWFFKMRGAGARRRR